MAKITLSSGVLRKGVRSTRAAAVLGQRASLFGVGRRGRAELAALNLKPASTGEDQMTANELKLYHAAASPNWRRVRIFLAEKGLAVPLVPVDLGKGEQHGEAYRAINPRRVVPTLVLEDGTAIGEVLAIWRYLEEAYPTPPLLVSTPKDKALVTMWERRAELEGFAAVMEGVRNASERLKGRAIAGPYDYDQIPALVERSRLRVKNFYADLDARLSALPFIAGDHFSADITGLVTADFAAKAMSFPFPDEHKALRRWVEKISSRPSAAV
jgi:glutathione S-transferase